MSCNIHVTLTTLDIACCIELSSPGASSLVWCTAVILCKLYSVLLLILQLGELKMPFSCDKLKKKISLQFENQALHRGRRSDVYLNLYNTLKMLQKRHEEGFSTWKILRIVPNHPRLFVAMENLFG